MPLWTLHKVKSPRNYGTAIINRGSEKKTTIKVSQMLFSTDTETARQSYSWTLIIIINITQNDRSTWFFVFICQHKAGLEQLVHIT